jgi:NTP pyrophosphatase (non-canonical NTP hydrolase)
MLEAGDSQRLRTRARQMLELANRAYCEKHYDFARLLTLLATEAFEHASEMDRERQSRDQSAAR